MDHRYHNIIAKVLFITVALLVTITSDAMQNSQSLPEQSSLVTSQESNSKSENNLKQLQKILSHNKKRNEIKVLVSSNQPDELDKLLDQEAYEQAMKGEKLSEWISLACSKKSHKTAALFLARYERNAYAPSFTLMNDHAFSQADTYKILTDFSSSLDAYRKKYPLEKN